MVYDRNGNACTRSEVSTIFTKPYTTDVLTDAQVIFIAQQLPSPKATTGRPAYSNQELLPGILRVLRSGCRWRDLNLPGYPDGSTHWRRLRLWRKGLHFRWLWKRILKLLDEQNPEEKERRFKRLSIDGTLLQSFAFREKTGLTSPLREFSHIPSLLVVKPRRLRDPLAIRQAFPHVGSSGAPTI